MADFCKKCSIKMFGEDYGDLANLLVNVPTPYITSVVICESCGPIQVNHLGECISPDCKECKINDEGTCASSSEEASSI